MFKTMHKLQIMIGAVAVSMVCSSCFALTMKSAPDMGLFKKKKKTVEQPVSDYKKLVGSDTVNVKGVMNVVKKDQDFYLEMPVKLMGRVFLVSNKLQRVPNELNEAGVNRGINYENQCVRFEWDKKKKTVFVRQQRVTPEVDQKDAMAASVENNYIDPLIASLKVEAVANDSSTVIFKVNDLFNGKKTYFNDVFNLINLGTSADSDLSHIIDIKAFSNNVTATSELTTVVHEGKSKTNVTVEVSCSLVLLPEQPMVARKENQRVGYFTTSRLQYGDRQQEVSEISRSLKALARELDVPVLALSQLSRGVEARQVKRPMLSDLRESGSLEQDADIVAFLYREDYYNPETENKHTELIIAKHRNGPVDTVNLFFHKQFTKFVGFTKRED